MIPSRNKAHSASPEATHLPPTSNRQVSLAYQEVILVYTPMLLDIVNLFDAKLAARGHAAGEGLVRNPLG